MKPLILVSALLALFLTASHAEPQVTCFQYGNMTSCDGPRGRNTLQTDFGNGQGVIMDERGDIIPYAVLPPPSARQPNRPLPDTLPRLPSLQPPTVPALPPSTFETPTTPLFLPGFGGEAGSP